MLSVIDLCDSPNPQSCIELIYYDVYANPGDMQILRIRPKKIGSFSYSAKNIFKM